MRSKRIWLLERCWQKKEKAIENKNSNKNIDYLIDEGK
jgi:hypothetical protein